MFSEERDGRGAAPRAPCVRACVRPRKCAANTAHRAGARVPRGICAAGIIVIVAVAGVTGVRPPPHPGHRPFPPPQHYAGSCFATIQRATVTTGKKKRS